MKQQHRMKVLRSSQLNSLLCHLRSKSAFIFLIVVVDSQVLIASTVLENLFPSERRNTCPPNPRWVLD
jgi:hypothetical protein